MGIVGLLMDTDSSGGGEKFGLGKVGVEFQGSVNFLEFLEEGDNIHRVEESGDVIDITVGGGSRAKAIVAKVVLGGTGMVITGSGYLHIASGWLACINTVENE
jgi:hypothetical protein